MAHTYIQSKDAGADLAFLADVMGTPPSVDAGGGWMIYALPPAELAPSGDNDVHSLYLMCDDIDAFSADMKGRGAPVSDVHHERWGKLVHVVLPGGGKIGVYEPLHPSPKAKASGKAQPKAKTQPRATPKGRAAPKKAGRKQAKRPAKKAKKGTRQARR